MRFPRDHEGGQVFAEVPQNDRGARVAPQGEEDGEMDASQCVMTISNRRADRTFDGLRSRRFGPAIQLSDDSPPHTGPSSPPGVRAGGGLAVRERLSGGCPPD